MFDFARTLERTGLREVATGYLGERPTISINKCTLRKVDPDVVKGHTGISWHQDGAFLGDVRALNVWLTLSHCGDTAPGLDIVPKRIDHVVPAGTEGAAFDWSVSPAVVDEVSEGTPVQASDLRARGRDALRRALPARHGRRHRHAEHRATRSRAGSSARPSSPRATRPSPSEFAPARRASVDRVKALPVVARLLGGLEIRQRLLGVPQGHVQVSGPGLVRRAPETGCGILAQLSALLVRMVEVLLVLDVLFLAPAPHRRAACHLRRTNARARLEEA